MFLMQTASTATQQSQPHTAAYITNRLEEVLNVEVNTPATRIETVSVYLHVEVIKITCSLKL